MAAGLQLSQSMRLHGALPVLWPQKAVCISYFVSKIYFVTRILAEQVGYNVMLRYACFANIRIGEIYFDFWLLTLGRDRDVYKLLALLMFLSLYQSVTFCVVM
jgi:hypothetical protein